MMKIEQRCYNVVDYKDLDKLINEVCNLPKQPDYGWNTFAVVCDMDWRNDTFNHVLIEIPDNLHELVEEYQEWREAFIESAADRPYGTFDTIMILEMLAASGYIEPGEYLVEVSW